MTRRSFVQVAAQAVAAERVGIKRHAAEHRARVDRALASGRIGADEATWVKQQIEVFVGEVATGLHVEGDGPETRSAVRAALSAAGFLSRKEQGRG